MVTDDYDHEYECAGETVRVAVHCGNTPYEPRIRWQVRDHNGERGYVQLDREEPVVRLEEGEIVRFQGQLVSEIPVPRSIGKALDDEVVERGTIAIEDKRLTTDPAAFPREIDGYHRCGWEEERSVMWYWRDEQPIPRAYQIESDELVFRAQEWADPVTSKRALVDRYDLTHCQS